MPLPSVGASSDGSSTCNEKSDVFFGGGAGAGADSGSGPAAEVVACIEAGDFDVDVAEAGVAVLFVVFFFVFRATDRGLNISGLPTSLTSSAGFIVSGIEGSAGRLGGGKFNPPGAAPSAPLDALEASSSRLKPLSALVLRLMPGRVWLLPAGLLSVVALPVFFGGGRNELKPEKRPPPPVRARFAGGSSPFGAPSPAEEATWGRLMVILPGFARSTTFWKAGFLGGALVTTGWAGASISASDSESE